MEETVSGNDALIYGLGSWKCWTPTPTSAWLNSAGPGSEYSQGLCRQPRAVRASQGDRLFR